jgi:hypothetical protein
VLEAEIDFVDRLARLAGGFGTIAGVGQVGGDELQFKQEVGAVGAAGEREGVAARAKADTDGLSGEKAARPGCVFGSVS